MKTVWRNHRSQVWTFFCPLCKASRRLAHTPTPTARHYIQIALTSLAFTLSLWQWFGLKGLVSFVPFWTLFEVMYRLRVRAQLACPQCGFDPYLFLTDKSRSNREIENHWRRKFEEKGIPFPDKAGQKPKAEPPSPISP